MRVLTIGDSHCGHLVGLTPPEYQITPSDSGDDLTKLHKFARVQRECWRFYTEAIKATGPYDVVIFNGDAIDGQGHRSGGTEQATLDRLRQVEMAEQCIQVAKGRRTKLIMTIGTAYHTGDSEDFESIIASNLNAEKCGSHEWVDISGVVFDCKHHLGSSAIPHGRHTAVARDYLWSVMWSERELQPKSDIILRSHVHYYQFCGGVGWVGMTLPALQGFGTKYGSRRCSGLVDFGIVVWEVKNKSFSWKPYIMKGSALQATVTKL